jgi:hypothetical protein
VPVKSFLFDQNSKNVIGAVKRKQTFTLELFDDDFARDIEKYRKINDLVTLLSISLGTNIHWIPEAAKPLLEAELDQMEYQAKKTLTDTLSEGIDEWVEKRWARYSRDLRKMYKELHDGEGEPDPHRMERVRSEITSRLTKAMHGRIVPKITYSSFIPHVSFKDEGAVSGLGKVLQLLKSSAIQMREPFHNSYFERNFSNRRFDLDAWLSVMNIFSDTAPDRFKDVHYEAPKREKLEIETIYNNPDLSEKEKLSEMWSVIRRLAP